MADLARTLNCEPDTQSASLADLSTLLARNSGLVFSAALTVSAACKILRLDSRELWLDETYSAFVARLPFRELLRYCAGDVHPPLFYALLWLWVRAIGDSQAQLRLFSVVLSICATVGMFFLAKRALGAAGGAFAGSLFAFSPMLFVYSLEVRMYMLLILVLVGLLAVHWMVVAEQRTTTPWLVSYGVLAALLVYVHYIAVFVLLGLFADWAIACRFKWKGMARVGAASVLTLVLVSPALPTLLNQRARKARQDHALAVSHRNPDALSYEGSAQAPAAPGPRLKNLAIEAAAMCGFFPARRPILLLPCAVPLLVALSGIGYLSLAKRDPICRMFVLVLLTVGAGVVALHLQSTRYLLIVVPLLALAISRVVQYAVETERVKIAGVIVGALVLVLYAAGFFRQSAMRHGRPWQELEGVLQQNYHPGEPVIFDALYAQVPFDYFARYAHFQPEEMGFPLSVYDWWNEQDFKGWGGPVIMRSDLDRFVAKVAALHARTVWLVLDETYYYDPHNQLLAVLGESGHKTEFRFLPERYAGGSTQDDALYLVRVDVN